MPELLYTFGRLVLQRIFADMLIVRVDRKLYRLFFQVIDRAPLDIAVTEVIRPVIVKVGSAVTFLHGTNLIQESSLRIPSTVLRLSFVTFSTGLPFFTQSAK